MKKTEKKKNGKEGREDSEGEGGERMETAKRRLLEEDNKKWFVYPDGKRLRACACDKIFNHCVVCNSKARNRPTSKCAHGNPKTRCKKDDCAANFAASVCDAKCEHGKTRKICRRCTAPGKLGSAFCPRTLKRRSLCGCGGVSCGAGLCHHLNKNMQPRSAARCSECNPEGALWSFYYNKVRNVIQTQKSKEAIEARKNNLSVRTVAGCSREEFLEHLRSTLPDTPLENWRENSARWVIGFFENPMEPGIKFRERMERFHFSNVAVVLREEKQKQHEEEDDEDDEDDDEDDEEDDEDDEDDDEDDEEDDEEDEFFGEEANQEAK
jgi:hypothetical protein